MGGASAPRQIRRVRLGNSKIRIHAVHREIRQVPRPRRHLRPVKNGRRERGFAAPLVGRQGLGNAQSHTAEHARRPHGQRQTRLGPSGEILRVERQGEIETERRVFEPDVRALGERALDLLAVPDGRPEKTKFRKVRTR